MNKYFLIIVLLLASGPLAAACNNPSSISKAPNIAACIAAANSGDIEAQLALGKLYIDGLTVPQNYEESLKWFRKAADQGNARAIYNIGVFYDRGYGVEKSFEKAAEWYQKAADAGYPFALYNIGVMYEYGQIFPKDLDKARGYYLQAAEKGEPSAQFSLGLLYEKGLGVEQDLVKAYMWWDITGEGHRYAAHNRDSLEEDMTPEQIAEAKQLARDWWTQRPHLKQLPPETYQPGFE
ncbi:MAG TPA: hypothetical protein DCZ13_06960 [Porticoccaceae bacterium]|nr:hypothetical protein [Porticoccaceae bacterium]